MVNLAQIYSVLLVCVIIRSGMCELLCKMVALIAVVYVLCVSFLIYKKCQRCQYCVWNPGSDPLFLSLSALDPPHVFCRKNKNLLTWWWLYQSAVTLIQLFIDLMTWLTLSLTTVALRCFYCTTIHLSVEYLVADTTNQLQ